MRDLPWEKNANGAGGAGRQQGTAPAHQGCMLIGQLFNVKRVLRLSKSCLVGAQCLHCFLEFLLCRASLLFLSGHSFQHRPLPHLTAKYRSVRHNLH